MHVRLNVLLAVATATAVPSSAFAQGDSCGDQPKMAPYYSETTTGTKLDSEGFNAALDSWWSCRKAVRKHEDQLAHDARALRDQQADEKRQYDAAALALKIARQGGAAAVVDHIGQSVANKLGMGSEDGKANPMTAIAQRLADGGYKTVGGNRIVKTIDQTTTNGSIRIMGVAIRAFEQAEARWNASARELSGGISVPSQWAFTALGFDPATGSIAPGFAGYVAPKPTYQFAAPIPTVPSHSVPPASASSREVVTTVRREIPFEEYRKSVDARRAALRKQSDEFAAQEREEEQVEAEKLRQQEAFQNAIIDAQIRSSLSRVSSSTSSKSSPTKPAGKGTIDNNCGRGYGPNVHSLC